MAGLKPELTLHKDKFEAYNGREYLPERMVSLDQYDFLPDENVIFAARLMNNSTVLDTETDEVIDNAYFFDIEVLGYLEGDLTDGEEYSAEVRPVPVEESDRIEERLELDSREGLVGEIPYRVI